MRSAFSLVLAFCNGLSVRCVCDKFSCVFDQFDYKIIRNLAISKKLFIMKYQLFINLCKFLFVSL